MRTRQPRRTHTRPKAVTADIVGPATSAGSVHPKWAQAQKRLLDLRDYLQLRRSDLAKDALEETPTYSSHMADAGTDTYDRDIALGLLSSEQEALYEIEEALARIGNGTYGICELTGKAIEPSRLAAIPWARFSAAAEEQLEREGALKRNRRLGPRESVAKEPSDTGEEQEP